MFAGVRAVLYSREPISSHIILRRVAWDILTIPWRVNLGMLGSLDSVVYGPPA
jgi:hypothetical protein